MFNWFFNLFKKADNTALIAALKSGQAVVIDVRTKGEFMSGHVADSLNIPLNEISANVAKIKKMDKTIVFCCASGNRSGQATRLLQAQGLDNIHNGGSWSNVNSLKSS